MKLKSLSVLALLGLGIVGSNLYEEKFESLEIQEVKCEKIDSTSLSDIYLTDFGSEESPAGLLGIEIEIVEDSENPNGHSLSIEDKNNNEES